MASTKRVESGTSGEWKTGKVGTAVFPDTLRRTMELFKWCAYTCFTKINITLALSGQIREKKNYQGFPIHYFNVPHLLSVLSHWLSLHNKMNQAKEGGGCYCQEEGAAEHWAPCDLPLCWPGPQRGRALPQNSWWVPIGKWINWPSCLLISLSRVWSQGLDSPELGSHKWALQMEFDNL